MSSCSFTYLLLSTISSIGSFTPHAHPQTRPHARARARPYARPTSSPPRYKHSAKRFSHAPNCSASTVMASCQCLPFNFSGLPLKFVTTCVHPCRGTSRNAGYRTCGPCLVGPHVKHASNIAPLTLPDLAAVQLCGPSNYIVRGQTHQGIEHLQVSCAHGSDVHRHAHPQIIRSPTGSSIGSSTGCSPIGRRPRGLIRRMFIRRLLFDVTFVHGMLIRGLLICRMLMLRTA